MESGKPLGFLDAYEDIHFLEHCFIETSCYKKSLANSTNYICGRRGTGKSAIVLKLMGDDKFRHKEEVKGHEFYQQLLLELKNEPVPDISRRYVFQRIWKHLILVAAMSAIVGDITDAHWIDGRLAPMYEYLKKNRYFGQRPLSLWQRIVGAAGGLVRKYRGKSELANILLGYLTELLESDDFIKAEQALRAYLAKETRCLVVIDTIMDNFERDEMFVACVEGLLLAVLDLTCQKYSPCLEVKCCVPGEVYREIRLYEMSKVRDHVVELNWRPKDLMRMIAKRMHYHWVLQGRIPIADFRHIDWASYHTTKEQVWDRYFPKYIVNNRRIEEPTHVYLLRHTQLTPREMIALLNNILYEYETRADEDLSTAIRVGVHDVISNTVSELIISNQFLMPNLEQMLATSFEGKPKIMSISEVRKALGSSKTFWKDEELDPTTEDLLIKKLMAIGFLGIVVGQDSENSHVIKCKFAHMVPDILALGGKDTQLAIHPIFYERFNIQPVTDKIVYPVRQSYDSWNGEN
jgi:hypothetical protein